MPSAPVKPVFLERPAVSLCLQPYPGHPRGCPNVGRRAECPPKAKPFWDIIEAGYAVSRLSVAASSGGGLTCSLKRSPRSRKR